MGAELCRVIAVVSVVLCSWSCSSRAEQAARYHTRGRVTAIEGSGHDLLLAIHHERIEAFKDREGKAAPMGSMIMMFGLDESIRPSQLAVGDKLAFDFDVRWELRPLLLLTRVEELPAETELTLTTEHR